ncbi:MAG TPA: nuclear transport factor 2 family protein [Hyphomicrobiaceae bacterium]|jgi:hypothetical protein|nr:nuclear transport factor 2 family protein [Hyphomicrobiaceae bacterium]
MPMTEDQVRKLEEERYAAMLAADVATLDRLLDAQLTYTHSSGVVDTKDTYIGGVRDKVWAYKAISRENERVVLSGACALAFCRLRIDVHVRGVPRKVDSNALAVWVETGGGPKLLAVHSAAVPA